MYRLEPRLRQCRLTASGSAREDSPIADAAPAPRPAPIGKPEAHLLVAISHLIPAVTLSGSLLIASSADGQIGDVVLCVDDNGL
jgi:hypothetical protein